MLAATQLATTPLSTDSATAGAAPPYQSELFADPPIPGGTSPWSLGALTVAITTTPASGTIETYAVAPAAPVALRAASGQFRVLVDNEEMIVAASLTGASPWSFTRGVGPNGSSTHSSGAAIYHTLTAGALQNLAANATAAGQSTSLQQAANLADLASAAGARTHLGLGTAATTDASAYAPAGSVSSGSGMITAKAIVSQTVNAIGTYSGLPAAALTDSITLADGDTALLTAEVSQINNGPWIVHAGAWARHPSLPTGSDATGTLVYVENGGQNIATLWGVQGNGPYIVGTNGTNWRNISRQFADRGMANAYSLYYPRDIVVTGDQRVLILVPCQASSTGTFSAGQYVVLQHLQVFNPVDYGAVINAVTDDTVALQNCINAAANSGVTVGGLGIGTSSPGLGGIVEIPHGYNGYLRISTTIDLPSNVWLRGKGWSTTVIQLLPNSNCHMIRTHQSTGTGNSNAFWSRISDLMLDGRNSLQGTLLKDCTLTPYSTTVTSAAGTFPANGTVLTGEGIVGSPTTIVSGGGTGSIVMSQPATLVTLQGTPGTSWVFCGGTTDVAFGAPIPWAGIYHEPAPYGAVRGGADNQFDPTHLISDVRIYSVCGNGVHIHGRSDVLVRHVKCSFTTGNAFQTDFDTIFDDCMAEQCSQNGLLCASHSSVRLTGCKLYNSREHGIKITGLTAAGEITMSGNDLQQNNLDGLHMDSNVGAHHAGVISQAGFNNTLGAMPTIATSWVASHAYANWRSAGTHALILGSNEYAVLTAGTSGTVQPTWPTTLGQTVVDGTVTWVCVQLPASVSLNNSSNHVIEGTATQDIHALRVTGTSAKNSIILGHYSLTANSTDLSPDSTTVTGSTNTVVMNGANLTQTVGLLNDAALTTPVDGQSLLYSGALGRWVNGTPGVQSAFASGLFGDGSDGAVILDGLTTPAQPMGVWLSRTGAVYTLTRDVNATNFTVDAAAQVITNGYRILCSGVYTDQAGSDVGNDGASGLASGVAPPASGSAQGTLYFGAAGGVGNTGAGSAGATNSGTAANHGVGGGGAGGLGSSGAGGGGTFSAYGSSAFLRSGGVALTAVVPFGGLKMLSGAPSGGGGGGDGTNKGGSGGSGAGALMIVAKTIVHAGVFSATGGGGGSPTVGNAGGGGGGGGGVVLLYSQSAWTNTGTTAVTGGAAGAGFGTGANGTAGGAGTVTNILLK